MGWKYESNAHKLWLTESNFHMACKTKNNFLNTFVCCNSWTYIVDLNLCTPKNFYFYFIFCCCTHKNFYFYFIFCCWTPKNFYLQCKHTHEYDLIFHMFVDRFMPDSCGAEPEHNMHESLVTPRCPGIYGFRNRCVHLGNPWWVWKGKRR